METKAEQFLNDLNAELALLRQHPVNKNTISELQATVHRLVEKHMEVNTDRFKFNLSFNNDSNTITIRPANQETKDFLENKTHENK